MLFVVVTIVAWMGIVVVIIVVLNGMEWNHCCWQALCCDARIATDSPKATSLDWRHPMPTPICEPVEHSVMVQGWGVGPETPEPIGSVWFNSLKLFRSRASASEAAFRNDAREPRAESAAVWRWSGRSLCGPGIRSTGVSWRTPPWCDSSQCPVARAPDGRRLYFRFSK